MSIYNLYIFLPFTLVKIITLSVDKTKISAIGINVPVSTLDSVSLLFALEVSSSTIVAEVFSSFCCDSSSLIKVNV